LSKQRIGVDLNVLIDDATFVVLDVETTGLFPQGGHRVIDISMIKWQHGDEIDTFGTLVNPCRTISAEASAVHGISYSDLVGAPLFSDIAGQVWEFLRGAVIVAHNAEFDVRFINYELAQAGYPQWDGLMVCTLRMARHLHDQSHNKLADVALRMGIKQDGEHSAVSDTVTTLLIFQAFLRRPESLAFQTLGHLVRAQGGWRNPPQAPGVRTLEQLQRSIA
jgi:DNA polymerase III epsilon subunit family exonuclease